MERIARIQSNRAHLTICHVKLNNAKPVWQAFEREGKGGLGGEGNARGARGGGGGRETPARKPLFSPSRLLIMYAKITQL